MTNKKEEKDITHLYPKEARINLVAPRALTDQHLLGEYK